MFLSFFGAVTRIWNCFIFAILCKNCEPKTGSQHMLLNKMTFSNFPFNSYLLYGFVSKSSQSET